MPSGIFAYDPETKERYAIEPSRDISRFAPFLVHDVAQRLDVACREDGFYERIGISEEDMSKTFAAFIQFFAQVLDPDIQHPGALAETVGFAQAPEAAKNYILAQFGRACVGAAFAGLRSAATVGDTPSILLYLRRRAAEFLEHGFPPDLRKPINVQTLLADVLRGDADDGQPG